MVHGYVRDWYLISGEGDCGEDDCGEVDCGEADCWEGEWLSILIPNNPETNLLSQSM